MSGTPLIINIEDRPQLMKKRLKIMRWAQPLFLSYFFNTNPINEIKFAAKSQISTNQRSCVTLLASQPSLHFETIAFQRRI